ncbi:TetR/AcrR family transcriptional regulator [Streptomyces sp. NPDC057376]|uniref:TetR/AcrR family transcriptional regulator n=1 Tax=unclassified Streptomyces TaxID=2593676 RepID=UPI00093D4EB6|nr:TetR/AcrR family transcriptional regulator [Streptomyces sp. CB02414]OKI81365.1 TetR family transcriptional regulator [Streptomyces sp. CB02414]
MTGASTTTASRPRTSRGRIDKRQAILDAAFTVFAREGYSNACVKEIAAEANVAKPTVYNHLSDKANLFRNAIEVAAETAQAENLAVVEQLTEPGDDLRASLQNVGLRLLQCYSSDRSWALRRLLYAEVARFPDLLETVRGGGTNRVTGALADRLARLTLDGRLRTTDPTQAAEQFIALLTGPVEARSKFGTEQLPEEDLRELAEGAVRTFLKAFGAEPARAVEMQ